MIELIGSGPKSGLPVLTSSCSLVQSREKENQYFFEEKLLEVRKQVICWNVRARPGQNMGEKVSSAKRCLFTLWLNMWDYFKAIQAAHTNFSDSAHTQLQKKSQPTLMDYEIVIWTYFWTVNFSSSHIIVFFKFNGKKMNQCFEIPLH